MYVVRLGFVLPCVDIFRDESKYLRAPKGSFSLNLDTNDRHFPSQQQHLE